MQQLGTVQGSGGIYGFRRARSHSLMEACRDVYTSFIAEVYEREAVVYRIHESGIKAPVLPVIERTESLKIPGLQDMPIVDAISEAILSIPSISNRVSPLRKSEVRLSEGADNSLKSLVLIPDDETVEKILVERQKIYRNLGIFASGNNPKYEGHKDPEIEISVNDEDFGIELATFTSNVDIDKIKRSQDRVNTKLESARMYLTPCVIFPKIHDA